MTEFNKPIAEAFREIGSQIDCAYIDTDDLRKIYHMMIKLTTIAENKMKAIQYRLDGKIVEASIKETYLEDDIRSLPQECRW